MDCLCNRKCKCIIVYAAPCSIKLNGDDDDENEDETGYILTSIIAKFSIYYL